MSPDSSCFGGRLLLLGRRLVRGGASTCGDHTRGQAWPTREKGSAVEGALSPGTNGSDRGQGVNQGEILAPEHLSANHSLCAERRLNEALLFLKLKGLLRAKRGTGAVVGADQPCAAWLSQIGGRLKTTNARAESFRNFGGDSPYGCLERLFARGEFSPEVAVEKRANPPPGSPRFLRCVRALAASERVTAFRIPGPPPHRGPR